MNFRQSLLVGSALLVGVVGCGKNLSQVLFHVTVDQRVRDSLSASIHVPAPVSLADPNSFRFAVFGDLQIRDENKNMLTAFKQEVVNRDIDFFTVLGDLSEDGTSEELTTIKADLDQVGVPYYATIGNHDLFQDSSKGGWDQWKSTFGAATYSVTLGGVVRIILLDTATGNIGATQFRWLENQLKTPVPFTLVGSHYPVNGGPSPSIWRLESVEERYKLTHLLNRYGVYAYVAGHLHAFEEDRVGNDILHLTVGSMYPYSLDFGSRGYVLFEYNHGSLTWQRIEMSSDSPE